MHAPLYNSTQNESNRPLLRVKVARIEGIRLGAAPSRHANRAHRSVCISFPAINAHKEYCMRYKIKLFWWANNPERFESNGKIAKCYNLAVATVEQKLGISI